MRTIKTYPDQLVAIGSDFSTDVASFLTPSLAEKKIVLVTGQNSFQASEQAELLAALLNVNEVEVVTHLTSTENPNGAKLEESAHELPAFDGILAIGGGSVIDAAKKT